MSVFAWVVVITAIAGMGGTGLGGFIGAVLRRDSSKIVSLLLSFAGGVMLAVVCFDLLPESFMPEGAVQETPLWFVTVGVLAGYGIIYLLNDLIDRKTNPEVAHIDASHPATADDLDELIHADHYQAHKSRVSNNYELFIAGIVMACAIALHNMPEGMVIGASYAGDAGEILTGSGFIIAVVIGLHNIPEGMAVSVPLISGGMNKWKAIGATALTGFPTVIGAIIGYSLGLLSPLWLAAALSFAGGAMLYVVFGELLPEAILMWRSKLPAFFMLVGTLAGLVLVHI
ncbi:MAG: ZIP family metal transporter [Clostridiales bacterium]|nr:ZIP family metal transporter [Candidatus Cacconaster stercorequi]